MTADEQKKAAAVAALEYVKPGNKVGLGTGSTANHFIVALADKVREGLNVECVATSRASFQLASSLGLSMTTLEKQSHLDVTVDGADEFDAEDNIQSQLDLLRQDTACVVRAKSARPHALTFWRNPQPNKRRAPSAPETS